MGSAHCHYRRGLRLENHSEIGAECAINVGKKGERRTNMKGMALWLCLMILGFCLVGCAGLYGSMERPHINIANVMPREIKLFEQVFDLELRIQNPNDSALTINGLAFELDINDKRFATGVSNQTVTIDRLSSDTVRVEAITTLWGFL